MSKLTRGLTPRYLVLDLAPDATSGPTQTAASATPSEQGPISFTDQVQPLHGLLVNQSDVDFVVKIQDSDDGDADPYADVANAFRVDGAAATSVTVPARARVVFAIENPFPIKKFVQFVAEDADTAGQFTGNGTVTLSYFEGEVELLQNK